MIWGITQRVKSNSGPEVSRFVFIFNSNWWPSGVSRPEGGQREGNKWLLTGGGWHWWGGGVCHARYRPRNPAQTDHTIWNTIIQRCHNAAVMLGQRRRRWPNIKSALGQRIVFARIPSVTKPELPNSQPYTPWSAQKTRDIHPLLVQCWTQGLRRWPNIEPTMDECRVCWEVRTDLLALFDWWFPCLLPLPLRFNIKFPPDCTLVTSQVSQGGHLDLSKSRLLLLDSICN